MTEVDRSVSSLVWATVHAGTIPAKANNSNKYESNQVKKITAVVWSTMEIAKSLIDRRIYQA